MITVINNKPRQTIAVGKVDFHPGTNVIKEEWKLKALWKNKEGFDKYIKVKIPGTRTPIFEIVSGEVIDPELKKKASAKPVKGSTKGGQNKKGAKETETKSPFANKTEEEALEFVELMLDVPSLETVIATEDRESVIEKAKEQLALVREE